MGFQNIFKQKNVEYSGLSSNCVRINIIKIFDICLQRDQKMKGYLVKQTESGMSCFVLSPLQQTDYKNLCIILSIFISHNKCHLTVFPLIKMLESRQI